MKQFILYVQSIILLSTLSLYSQEWPIVFTCKNGTTAHLAKVTNCKKGCNPTQQINFKKTPDCKTDQNLLELVSVGGMATARCNNYYQTTNPESAPTVVCGGEANVDYVQILGDQKTSSLLQLQPAKK